LRESSNWLVRDGHLRSLTAFVDYAVANIPSSEYKDVCHYAIELLKDDNLSVRHSAITCVGRLLRHCANTGAVEHSLELAAGLAPLLRDEATQIRIDTCAQLQLLGEATADGSVPCLPVFAPALMGRVGDSNGPARIAAQRALYYLLQFHQSAALAEKVLAPLAKQLSENDRAVAHALVNYCQKTLSKCRFAEEAKEEALAAARAPAPASSPTASSSSSSSSGAGAGAGAGTGGSDESKHAADEDDDGEGDDEDFEIEDE